jgi:hypothetical protein
VQDQPYYPLPKEGCNESIKPSTGSKIKKAPIYLNLLPLESAPLDILPLLSTDLILLLLKPEFTGQYMQEPTPTNI